MAEAPEIQPATSSQDSLNRQTQVPPNGNVPMFPIMCPVLAPGLFPQPDHGQMNRGPGLYAVGSIPSMQPFPGFSSNALIPFTYNIPTEPSPLETVAVDGEQGQVVEQQQQAGPQGQVVMRRFQIAFQLDLLLILKLAMLHLFIYIKQELLAPLIRWLSQGMQRTAPPPQPPRPDVPAAGRQGNENADAADGQPGVENENQQVNNGDRLVENEHVVEPGGGEAGGLQVYKNIISMSGMFRDGKRDGPPVGPSARPIGVRPLSGPGSSKDGRAPKMNTDRAWLGP
ncbi:hypothetical protein Adt_06774 [Abeliophyllum distichum]|uniref:Uncharacterized protein n=1 Tax=Abeliophyllum distichum TaxID=126358 RepID=A0ABD1V977_9LAMI